MVVVASVGGGGWRLGLGDEAGGMVGSAMAAAAVVRGWWGDVFSL